MAGEKSWTTGRLDGKLAVVTGAARGIGRASAIALAQAGALWASTSQPKPARPSFAPAPPAELAETGDRMVANGARWQQFIADHRNITDLRAIGQRVEEDWGGVDIVFANAGIQVFKPLLEMDDADLFDEIDNNLNGTANVLRAFAPLLVRRAAAGLSSPPPRRANMAQSGAARTPHRRGESSA